MTGRGFGCPLGYTATTDLYTPNHDNVFNSCGYKDGDPNPPTQYVNFGGMYGSGYPNPATGNESCPSGYTASQAYGSTYDNAITVCWQETTPKNTKPTGLSQALSFGGMYGYGNRSKYEGLSADFVYNNPFTGGLSCPTGYRAAPVLGYMKGAQSDYPLYLCYMLPSDFIRVNTN